MKEYPSSRNPYRILKTLLTTWKFGALGGSKYQYEIPLEDTA